MKVGVQLPEVERFVPWPEVFAMARAAEDVGFDSIWLGDHLLYDLPNGSVRGPWEVWTSLAAIAAITTRVELGPLVASIGFHEPTMLAKQAATVDAISGGRLILGLGAGWNEREYRAFGFPYDQRVSRFEEAFEIIRRLLAGESVDFDGRFYSIVRGQIDPLPRAGIPMMIGSTKPRMLSIALPHVQSWNVWWSRFGNSVEGFTREKAFVDEQCELAGRAPGAVQATAAVYVQVQGGSGRTMGSDGGDVVRPLRGSQVELAEQLRAFGAAGADQLQLVVDPITQASIEWLGGVLELI